MMNPEKMTVVQCWDDGVTTDIRLIEILRRYHAKATFNLCAGWHEKQRKPVKMYQGTQITRLGRNELESLYEGFTIANHSLTHPHLEQMAVEEMRHDIQEGRDRLQQLFGQPISGFAYPFGTYNAAVEDAVREAGHIYARTVQNVEHPFPVADAMAFHPCCHFQASDFFDRYQKARSGGVFYFWGHSYEIVTDAMWDSFEEKINYISHDPAAQWGTVSDLFTASASDSYEINLF
ncbi:MAG: polysaccharide deacetylase family protein [Holophagae bacterium]|nr:polysaccharide deacetylase family protein [Holophagae bacterium]